MKSVCNFLYLGYNIPHISLWNKEASDSFNRLHIPMSGSAVVRIEDREYILKPGNIYLLPSHTDMYIGSHGTDKYEHIYFDFFISPIITNKSVIVMDIEKDNILRDFKNMLANRLLEMNGGRYIQLEYFQIPTYMEFFLRSFLAYVFEHYGVKQHENDRLSKALMYIYSHYSENINNEDIAASIYVHPRHLIRLFKEELNMTPHQCLTEYRLNMAINMLKEGLQIKDVYRRCGFEDRNTFRKAFKKMNNVPPSEYSKVVEKDNKNSKGDY